MTAIASPTVEDAKSVSFGFIDSATVNSISDFIPSKLTENEDSVKKDNNDFTNIFIACCRLNGLPARYVSGFLLLENKQIQEAMHAWAEVFVDGLGWVGFDTANKISPDDRYIRVAIGRDYSDAAPIKGVTLGVQHECLSVSILISEQ